MKRTILLAVLIVALLAATGCSLLFNGEAAKIEEALPSVKGYDNLLEILSGIASTQAMYYMTGDRPMPESADSAKNTLTPSQGAGNDYSGTNVQVQGVDEADIIKTDGEYIYQVNENSIVITKAYPVSEMKVAGRISFNDETFYPYELYLDDKYLVVIGNTYYHYPMPYIDGAEEVTPGVAPDEKKEDFDSVQRFIPYYGRDTVKVMIYNIETPENAYQVRSFETEGHYLSSRKIGSHLYLISNKYIYLYDGQKPDEAIILPWYRDSLKDEEFKAVSYDSIRYFPGSQDSSYLLITGLDMDKMESDINVQAFLGSGQTIYASTQNLYVAYPKWEHNFIDAQGSGDAISDKPAEDIARIMPIRSSTVNTSVYRFTLSGGNATFAAKGEVPGNLLNQFSMDEHNNHFRIATTIGDAWRSDEFTSTNNLYVLNSRMETVGKIEGIAPGERIYSVRFMGDKGYMVTFRTVDPLFVLDLKNPQNPTILGELKIPGYSDYLHPYDENHIIGFGMDAVEANIVDDRGNVLGTTVYQLGMKVAMFDVSDATNPVEKYSISIGDRGTYSDLLHNHRALVFSSERNLMAFPVTIMQSPTGKPLEYGSLSFQGMMVYNVDPDNGFVLQAQITHLTDQELKDAPKMWFDYNKAVERGLYIEDVFYTISKMTVKATSLQTFQELGSISLR
ncbi:MAG: beta-propeller domain-containing protein [Clostridia bacterium]